MKSRPPAGPRISCPLGPQDPRSRKARNQCQVPGPAPHIVHTGASVRAVVCIHSVDVPFANENLVGVVFAFSAQDRHALEVVRRSDPSRSLHGFDVAITTLLHVLEIVLPANGRFRGGTGCGIGVSRESASSSGDARS